MNIHFDSKYKLRVHGVQLILLFLLVLLNVLHQMKIKNKREKIRRKTYQKSFRIESYHWNVIVVV